MYLTIYSIQKSASEHSPSPKRYLILPLVSKIGVLLTLITTVIVGLALVISRSLPNQGTIAFVAHYDGNADIYTQDIEQGVLVNLTNNNATNANVAFSPDGRQMIFISSINGGIFQLYLKEVKCDSLFATCGGLHQLTNRVANIVSASWSPTGNQIAYVTENEIYVLNVESDLAYNLTQNPTTDFAPVWSPDGRQIAFESQRDSDTAEIYVVNSDGSHLQRLTHNDVWDYPPIWSPDGRQIAFMSYNDSGDDLLVLNIRDGSIRNLTPDPLQNVGSPTWSLDGSQIEFWAGNSQSSFLYVVDLLQDGPRKLIVSLAGSNQYFTRLPDGHYMLLHGANEMEATDLYLLDGSRMRLIAHQASPPVWWP